MSPPELLTAAQSEVDQVALVGVLAAQGVVEGDRVAVIATPSTAVVSLALGALRAGIVPVMINPALTESEQSALLADCAPAAVVDDGWMAQASATPSPSAPAPVSTSFSTSLSASDEVDLSDLPPYPRARPMHYTSGTGGAAKGVWSGLWSGEDAAALVADETEVWGITADDVHLVCAPLAHSAPLRFAMMTLLAGGSVVVLPRFSVDGFVDAVARWRPTSTFMAPVHLQRLLADPSANELDLSTFRLVAHAGSACSPAVKEAALSRFPRGSVWEFYGSTEGQFTIASPSDWATCPDSVGRPRPGRDMRVDEDGVLWSRPPAFARFSYWGDATKTAATWDGDWFTVGDLGRIKDGFVYLDGRRDDLIISGGVNVYPAEVEAALSRCPGLTEVAVYGIDDPEWGQKVCAAVVGDAPEAQLRAFAEANLAGYKRPKQWTFVTELPRTATGKVRRSELSRPTT